MSANITKLHRSQIHLNEANASLILARSRLIENLLDPKSRNYNKDAGYPNDITLEMYFAAYEREGTATRVVNVFPDETWASEPDVYETFDPKDTPFEERWKELLDEANIYHYLHRVDEISGIGQYAGLMISVEGGGSDLQSAPPGFDDPSLLPGPGRPPQKRYADGERKINFLLPIDQRNLKINKIEQDRGSPRFGQPLLYEVNFASTSDDLNSTGVSVAKSGTNNLVHWSRILHVADNREGPIYGIPRQRAVYNRILDLRKDYAGAGEMLWKGGFPGISFEALPELALNEVDFTEQDKEDLKAQIKAYMNSTQRYLSLVGFTAKSLTPQIADPTPQIMAAITNIAMVIGVPVRVFLGSEAAHLASTQDIQTWNRRLLRRQNRYVTPMLLRPFIQRLIALGCLPKPKKLFVEWPDLNTPSDRDQADIAFKKASALQLYITSQAWRIMTPEDFYVNVMGYKREEGKLFFEAAKKIQKELKKMFPEPAPATKPAAGKASNQSGRSSTRPAQSSVK